MNASLPRPNAPPKKKHFLLALTSGVMTVPAPAPPAGWRPHNTTLLGEGKKQTGGVHHRSKVLIKNNHKDTFIESFFQNECEKQDAEMWSFRLIITTVIKAEEAEI